MDAPTKDEILLAVERLCHSRTFDNQENARKILRYIASIIVEGGIPSERDIAIEALGRRPDFNPRSDAVVRVTAGKLRQLMGDYYAEAGKRDDIVLTVPKRGYTLEAERRFEPNSAGAPPEKEHFVQFASTKRLWPSVYASFLELCTLPPFEVYVSHQNLPLPRIVLDFFAALNNCKVFVTTFDSFVVPLVHIFPISKWVGISLALSRADFEIEMVKGPAENSRYYGSYEEVSDGGVRLNAQICDDLLTGPIDRQPSGSWCQ